jgi:hypothetical protein
MTNVKKVTDSFKVYRVIGFLNNNIVEDIIYMDNKEASGCVQVIKSFEEKHSNIKFEKVVCDFEYNLYIYDDGTIATTGRDCERV